MLYVPLYAEFLRTRPGQVAAAATLAQALVWFVVPVLFYAAPPGDLPEVLAIGRHFPLQGDFGPPLAYWLAAAAFRAGGIAGVYALAQLCVIAIYACVFALGRAIVGATHAALAVLLLTGVSVFTVPSPAFGPPLLAAVLWALLLLHYWRAMVRKRRMSWLVVGAAAALLLATAVDAVVLIALIVVFTLGTARGRAALRGVEPKIVGVLVVAALVVQVHGLRGAGVLPLPTLGHLRDAMAAGGSTVAAWLRLVGALVLAHAGLVILLILARGWPRASGDAPVLTRAPPDPLASTYVATFALAPAVLTTLVTVLAGTRLPISAFAPLLVLSGLAAVVAAGDSIALRQPRILGAAWTGLLIVPALFVPLVIVFLPWTVGTDLKVAQPAAAMGRFFADRFQHRTGQPLAIVSGDDRLAALVALAAPSRPSVYFATDPARSPWVDARDIAAHGIVVVWPASDVTAEPPPAIRTIFPTLVPEVPQTFDRTIQGRLRPLRIGWGMIRPASAPPPTPSQPP